MVFLGFLLVAAAIAIVVGVVLDNTEPANLIVFGQTVPGVNEQWQIFLAGAGVAVVFFTGMMLTFIGAGRRVRNRRDLRDLREEHEESLTTLEMEKRRLQRELARVRQNPGARPGPGQAPVPPSGPGGHVGGHRRSARRETASAVQGTHIAGRSQIPASSPFFDRQD
ncbi:hypothetical protein [Actinomadura sp. KC06]|uniref:hypothetical protein n=1 Tax=Actinomadura sp. KC06 TaxID=2530369 RepID=UPI001A9DBDDC|nr:hypothetical protein [Actinomadura sp. KC06]